MSNHKEALDFFGKVLIEQVRDESIEDWERILGGKMKDEESQQLFNEVQSLHSEQLQLIMKLIPKVVDSTLHHFLWTLEQEEEVNIVITLEEENPINIRENSDGLAGELYTEDGWISRFSSKQKG
ncbi:epimerase [Planococcus salinarum]|uniref:epimerase n=1 Tax=Planococcus salinarum TaxID=622695 RepID=UPI000E3BBA54|nr:epimerase [Planococcus salinarum]TAA72665.1 epimerase [Planococcus salinarum]